MPVRINKNMAFNRSKLHLAAADRAAGTRRERLSSGLRINSGADSGGHLVISEGMRAEIGGLAEGTRNAEKAIDLLQTAEGAMNIISTILVRMRDLATQATTDTLNDFNRSALDTEFNQLKDYIDRVGKMAAYNGQTLLSGFGNNVDANTSTAVSESFDSGVLRIDLAAARKGNYLFTDNQDDGSITLSDGTETQTIALGSILDRGKVADGTTVVANFDTLGIKLILAGEDVNGADGVYVDGDLDGKTLNVDDGVGGAFQLGSKGKGADRLEYKIRDLTVSDSVLNIAAVSIGTRASSRIAMKQIDEAIDRVTSERGAVGAVINRLQYTVGFTDAAIEGATAAESTVRDTDYALESSQLARAQLLSDLSQAAMVQSLVPMDIALSMLT